MARALPIRDGDAALESRPASRAAGTPESQAELLEALRRALAQEPRPPFDELAAMLRALTAGREHTPAEVLVRESRDER